MKIDENLTRGFRNNNPMNIVKSKDQWLGKRTPSTDAKFEQFFEMKFGIRAALKILTRYHRDYHWHTLKAIISHWAPASDGNNVEAYIAYVESQIKGLERTRQSLYKLVKAMCHVESQYRPETKELDKAWRNLPESMRNYWVPQS